MPWQATQTQRYLTTNFIAKRRLNAPAVWLNPQSSTSTPDDAVKPPEGLGTDLNQWMREEDERNLAVRLVDGFIELKIRAPDEVWLGVLFKAFRALGVDGRAAFGSQFITSIILRIDDPEKIDRWRELWPRGHKDKTGGWVETKFAYSAMPTPRSQAIWVDSSPLPGSIFAQKLVVWRPWGKPAADNPELGLDDLEMRPLAATNMESICRAIAFATLAYWINIYLDGLEDWDESLTRSIGGWIARLALEGQAINAQGKSLEGVCWSPVESSDSVSALLTFLGNLGAKRDLGVAFLHAEAALERNSQAPVPGWGSIETLFGVQAKVGIRRAFRAGLDIDEIERISERYVLDESEHIYLDREALLKGLVYEHKHDDLIKVYDPKSVFDAKGKPHNPFKLYARSSLRLDVQWREFYPGHEPGAVLRKSPVHGLLNGEDRYPDEYRLLNTFPGFFIKPVTTIETAVMTAVEAMLKTMLGLLTRDNPDQIQWLKKWIAWIVQHPSIKQQVCPILVGGQGIGKSRFGISLMHAIFDRLAGQAEPGVLTDNKFLITPFREKLVTFIDEVRLESVGSINAIKRLVREDNVSGQVKFQHQRDYYIPTRLILATNSPDIGLTPGDAADRCFYFIVSWTAENKHLTDNEFLEWTLTLKPFYDSVLANLQNVMFKRHLVRYFMDIEVNRAELEDLQYSSRGDESVVRSTMSKARIVARTIVADARVITGLDITARFSIFSLRDAIKRTDDARVKVEATQVLLEFQRAGVIEKEGSNFRFKYGYGKLLKKMGEAHGMEIIPDWPIQPVGRDWEDNGSPGTTIQWRGNTQNQPRDNRRYDPDYLDPE